MILLKIEAKNEVEAQEICTFLISNNYAMSAVYANKFKFLNKHYVAYVEVEVLIRMANYNIIKDKILETFKQIKKIISVPLVYNHNSDNPELNIGDAKPISPKN